MIDYQQILEDVKRDERYQRNLDWGAPRKGHPEGAIRAHIWELETNVDVLRSELESLEVDKLLILVHVHDTFKPDAVSGVSIADPRSHASLACRFLTEFCPDENLQAIVQWHDEPYAQWKSAPRGKNDATRRERLRENIGDWDLFTAFLLVDGCTPGKQRDPLHWFLTNYADNVGTRFGLHSSLLSGESA